MANPSKDLLAALQSQTVPSVVPKGYYTIKQLVEKTGQTKSAVEHCLGKQKVERKTFRVLVGSFARPVPHYKLL